MLAPTPNPDKPEPNMMNKINPCWLERDGRYRLSGSPRPIARSKLQYGRRCERYSRALFGWYEEHLSGTQS